MARKPVKSSVSVRGGVTCIFSCTIPAYAQRCSDRTFGPCAQRAGRVLGARKGAPARARTLAAGAAARCHQPRLRQTGGDHARRAAVLRAAALRHGVAALRELPRAVPPFPGRAPTRLRPRANGAQHAEPPKRRALSPLWLGRRARQSLVAEHPAAPRAARDARHAGAGRGADSHALCTRLSARVRRFGAGG